MDRMQATPRGAISGLLADAMFGGLNYMKDPRRTQQMQGLAAMLESTGVPAVVDRISYGEPLTTGRGMTTKLRPETENTLMAALGMTPVGKPAQAGAMALGRAGERLGMAAEKALEAPLQRVYDKGGLPREMLLAMGQNTVSPATVFHGTPHLFNKFDSSKIGTGEGAQAYGHGLYLAESPDVAKDYRNVLASPRNQVSSGKGVYIEPSPMGDGTYRLSQPSEIGQMRGQTGDATQGITDYQFKSVASAIKHAKKTGLLPKGERPLLTEIADEGRYNPVTAASQMQDPKYNQLIASRPGYLYQVDLPDEQIAKMLDYDKPLSEQPKIVQDFLLKNPDVLDYIAKAESQRVKLNEMSPMRLEKLKSASIPFDASRMTGKDAMTAIAQRSGLGKAAEAENMLRQAGIPGIRYLDQGSRGTGQGTSNFVVFPGMEDMLRIEQINNQPVESLFRSLGR